METTAVWQNNNLMSHFDDRCEKIQVHAEKTDSQLIELVLTGEKLCFEELVERYKVFLATIASRFFRRPEQIEEVVQISFIRIYTELESFHFRHDLSFAGWTGRITTNVCLGILRSRKRKPENLVCELSSSELEFLLTGAPHGEKTPEKLLIDRDLAEKLMACLEPEDQVILQMLYGEEMSVAEISEVTGWSGSKIKIRAYRARKALRKVIKRFV